MNRKRRGAVKGDECLRGSLAFVILGDLKEHEGIEQGRLEALRKEIESDGFLKKATAVDEKTWVILDGHHRLHSLRLLGCSKIPVYFIDYSSPRIHVKARWPGETVTKDDVIRAGLSGQKMPPRASKHLVELSGELKHISFIEKDVYVSLSKLL